MANEVINNSINEKPIVDVRNLRVSFHTNNGTVKAVRGISFKLYRGKTLAIVGESGSGKSVSSKAIMGLLAGNKIIEDGQILFDGKDLLKLSDDDFVQIRGSRISMIFQDPLSSLNPIMKVGKQLTEVMTLKNVSTKRLARARVKELKKTILPLLKDIDSENYKTNCDLLTNLMMEKDLDRILENPIYSNLLNTLGTLAKVHREMIISNMHEARKYLLDLISAVNVGEEYNYKEIKRIAPYSKSFMKNSIDSLADFKDSAITTFYMQFKSLNKKYTEVIKENRARAKFDKLIAKKSSSGKDVTQDLLKERAFSSEVQTTLDDVRLSILKLIKDLITHIDSLIEAQEPEYNLEARRIVRNLNKNYQDTKVKITKAEAREKAISLLKEVGIPEPERRFNQYPFELSGGMRQRIVIAIGLASNPEVLICDEPTTALDVTIQAQILELINKIKEERNLSIIFITHNLGVVANMADDIAVMYAGKIVEYADAYELFYKPAHPYTWALLASMPDLNSKERLHPIPGTPPNMILPPKGDAFAARNEFALNIDFEEEPPMFEISPNHYAATWLVAPNAPKVNPPKIVTERIKIMLNREAEVTK